jgi:SAM-dependent methyltransferase
MGIGASRVPEPIPEGSAKAQLSYTDWPNLYVRVGDWDEMYRSGECDWGGIGELPHYALIAGYVHKLINKGMLLDAGCGEAALVDYIDLERIGYFGFDISSVAVERANKRMPRGRAIQATFDGFLPPSDLKFDGIVFKSSLQYTPTPFETIDRYRSLLKNGGIMIVSTYQANKDLLFGNLLEQACNQGRYAAIDMADAVSVSHNLAWRIFVLR